MNIEAEFVRSAAAARDLPRDGLPEIALVGRSNVGKSSLINALVRRRVARTSAAPGKTRLANIYRVVGCGSAPFYLVDLPGYGYAPGGAAAARDFDALTRAYFGRVGQVGRVDGAALLLVDARHPGLATDRSAWQWLTANVDRLGIVATKIDKLSRGDRIRAVSALESVYEHPVVPVSAVTGEGLDDLWILMDRLLSSSNSNRNRSSRAPRRRSRSPRPEAMGARAATATPDRPRRKS
jgi:GTP-binding protein